MNYTLECTEECLRHMNDPISSNSFIGLVIMTVTVILLIIGVSWFEKRGKNKDMRAMADYDPVTKEELNMIKNDCAHPLRLDCEECMYSNPVCGCKWKGANVLMDEVLARERCKR